jgi:iron complex outermembrane receptor protein
VSYHIDGVYIFNSIAANAAFSDVSQIEGAARAAGHDVWARLDRGTINVVSTQPTTDKLSGYVDAGYGNYNYVTTNAALNVPITDTLAARGAIQFMKHDGYAKATDVAGQPGYPLSDANTISGKASIKWTPGTVFSLLLSTIQYRGDANGAEQKNVLDPNRSAQGDPGFPGTSYVRTQLYYGVAKLDFDGLVATSITSYQKLLSRQGWGWRWPQPGAVPAISGREHRRGGL